MKPFDFLIAILAGMFPLVVVAWRFDHVRLKAEAVEWQCKFEAIDPVRAEAGLPISEECACFWKNASLEELRQ